MPDWRGRVPLYREKEGEATQMCSSVITFIFGCIMLGIGHSYQDTCPNGAATFLFYAGIITMVSKVFAFVKFFAKVCAESDGVISGAEYCGLGLLTIISGLIIIADCMVLIWGTVVVFGVYPRWTYYKDDELSPLYCEYTPFMFSFVLLILDWIFLPMIVLCTCCGILCAMAK